MVYTKQTKQQTKFFFLQTKNITCIQTIYISKQSVLIVVLSTIITYKNDVNSMTYGVCGVSTGEKVKNCVYVVYVRCLRQLSCIYVSVYNECMLLYNNI